MPEPIIEDQYTAARAYFLCVVGLLFIESAIRWPVYFLELRNRGEYINFSKGAFLGACKYTWSIPECSSICGFSFVQGTIFSHLLEIDLRGSEAIVLRCLLKSLTKAS
jgi:hypothetical protein